MQDDSPMYPRVFSIASMFGFGVPAPTEAEPIKQSDPEQLAQLANATLHTFEDHPKKPEE
jgi:hypothetical protein